MNLFLLPSREISSLSHPENFLFPSRYQRPLVISLPKHKQLPSIFNLLITWCCSDICYLHFSSATLPTGLSSVSQFHSETFQNEKKMGA
ncbi:hypothetical protein TNCV_2964371 [Trichonephila clavipes]|nr:hypothetical protein TNCV_2964371 [Trichonephila clavipes]